MAVTAYLMGRRLSEVPLTVKLVNTTEFHICFTRPFVNNIRTLAKRIPSNICLYFRKAPMSKDNRQESEGGMNIGQEVWVVYKLKLHDDPPKTKNHYIGPAERREASVSPLGKKCYKIYLPEITAWNAPVEYVFPTKEAAEKECDKRNGKHYE